MQVVLVMFLADGERRDFPVTKPVTTIGRKPSCNFRIPVPTVSREHCRIELRNGQALVRDLGSSNGTFVNHKQVKEKALKPGDTLTIGPVNFIITVDGKPDALNPVHTDVNGRADRADAVAAAAGVSASAILDEDESSIVGPDASVESDDELLKALAGDEAPAPPIAVEEHEPTDEDLDNMTLDDLDEDTQADPDALSLDEPREGELQGLASSALDNLRDEDPDEAQVDVVEVQEQFANPFAEPATGDDDESEGEIDLQAELQSTEDELTSPEQAPESDLETMVQDEDTTEQPRDETDVFSSIPAEAAADEPPEADAEPAAPSEGDDPFTAMMDEQPEGESEDLSALADLLNDEEEDK